MAKDNDVIKSLQDEIEQLKAAIRSAMEQVQKANLRLDDIPTPRELGYSVPIHSVATDKYLKFQLDKGNLALLLNTDQIKRDLSTTPGAPGSPVICDGGDTTQIGEPGEGLLPPNEDSFVHDGELGCVVYVMTRVLYNHDASGSEGDPTLYGYQRPLIFDRNGNLCQVGIEERYVIDAPEPCDGSSA